MYALIRKGHVTGGEQACEVPSEDWKDINQFPLIAEGLLAMSEGRVEFLRQAAGAESLMGDLSPTVVLPDNPSRIIPLPGAEQKAALPDISLPTRTDDAPAKKFSLEKDDDGEKTQMNDAPESEERGEATEMVELPVPKFELEHYPQQIMNPAPHTDVSVAAPRRTPLTRAFAQDETLMLDGGRKKSRIRLLKWNFAPKEFIRATAIAVLLGVFGYEFVFEEDAARKTAMPAVSGLVRPRMPNLGGKEPNPEQSTKLYQEAMTLHVLDNVESYSKAAELLQRSIALDPGNVKAIAMLASSYLNLIDASRKDEEYFSIISKLIEMSKSKSVDLPETVVAEAEFYLAARKAEAAQERIVEYTKRHANYGMEMFYYLSFALHDKGDYSTASRFISQIPDEKAYSARIFLLRGQIAEKLGDTAAAEAQYLRGIALNAGHARSRLALAELLVSRQAYDEAKPHLNRILRRSGLLSPRDLARAYFLRSQVSQRESQYDVALSDIERAVKLEKNNHEYMLELYQLRGKSGESVEKLRGDARMYYFLSEGEKAAIAGNTHQALEYFLSARQAKDSSYLPFAKMGEMFIRKHDLVNARHNYKAAGERAPNNIDVWSHYMDVLIQSYEWEEAQAAMDRFRKLPVGQGAIDKAAGDLYVKQGRYFEGQFYYKKAMARESVDPEVYLAYAQSLEAVKNYKDAPFFYALALRSDPRQIDAIVGIARSIAATESIDRAIGMLNDVIERDRAPKAEILAAIAALELERGAADKADKIAQQAIAISPEAAAPWKIKAQIALSREGLDKKALDQALDAFESYSQRNLSDPSGYLERYKIFIKQSSFEKASEELNKIYEIYPKYPNLHYFKGLLYSASGNRRAAIDELKAETTNNPVNGAAWIALGKELVEAGLAQDALTAFSKAMQLAPQSAEPKLWMGYANYVLKNYAGAIALYKAALAIDKANSMIYKRMGLAYRESGDSMNAAQSFRRYLEIEPDAPDRAEFERYR